ncbi:MAG: FtsX-like permease family protein [Bacillota bacterium]|jgi:putative ABC transport system permease protein|nr:FtsX-like permease family protein [Bacillota bacterium]HHT90397.1 ABC transporter permease [Bacillota bacterium]
MRIILTIAWRNIREHKVKTTIIGVIMVIGIMVLVVGNSFMDSAAAGIERYYIKNYTGHLMITGQSRGNLTLFGYQDVTAIEQAVPRIPDYAEIVEFANSLPYVEYINPQVSGAAMISRGETMLGATQLFGVIPGQYQAMFPDNVELLEGEFWQPGEQGVLLNKTVAELLERRVGFTFRPGDKLLFTSASTLTGMRIREVQITGIFQFKQSNVQLDMVSLMDISNVRALAGMVVGHTTAVDLNEDERAFLGTIDEDDIFASFDSLFAPVEVEEGNVGDDYWFSLLGDTTGRDESNVEDLGAWQYLLVRLTDERYLRQAEADFARFFADQGIAAQTRTWLQGAGAMAELSYGIKSIFNGVVFVIAIVAIIIIMNTLVISVTERMAEIGTMRAIGAQKRFVRRMVVWETLLLSGVAGTIGVLCGALVLFILNRVGLKASNVFFEIIYGGPVLRPVLSLSSVIMSFVVILIVGVVASTYPTAIVMRTSPLKAMESSR